MALVSAQEKNTTLSSSELVCDYRSEASFCRAELGSRAPCGLGAMLQVALQCFMSLPVSGEPVIRLAGQGGAAGGCSVGTAAAPVLP